MFNEIRKYPKFNTKNRNGLTDYIDYLLWSEVTYPIMTGYDMYFRNFIVIKFWINGEKIMQTFFERHTNYYQRNTWGKYGWQGCGHATPNLLIETIGGMTKEQFDFIEEIVKNGKGIIKEEIRPYKKSYIGKSIYILDYYAALIIQKYWRKCRYNPKYQMCKRVQNRGIDELYGIT
tara:strand:+ start:299 stop:826 length:528 start_codon:yes stop_codon:yes gene_type:complete